MDDIKKGKCSKCLSDQWISNRYVYFEGADLEKKELAFCILCDNAYRATDLIVEFMKENFGMFPINRIDRDIINARRDRALGRGKWSKENIQSDELL